MLFPAAILFALVAALANPFANRILNTFTSNAPGPPTEAFTSIPSNIDCTQSTRRSIDAPHPFLSEINHQLEQLDIGRKDCQHAHFSAYKDHINIHADIAKSQHLEPDTYCHRKRDIAYHDWLDISKECFELEHRWAEIQRQKKSVEKKTQKYQDGKGKD